MERNENFQISGLQELNVRLAWAQLEIYTDDIDQIQVIASGDEHTVKELRIAVAEGALEIEQPQYGLSLDITHGHWMQLCVRVPKAWDQALRLNTISGFVNARGLGGESVSMETVTGDIKASQITAGQLSLKTTAGVIRGGELMCQTFTGRSVSGDITLENVSAKTYRFTSVSGNISVGAGSGFELMELRTVSGDCDVQTEVDAVRVLVRTVSGHKTLDNVKQTDDPASPSVRFIGVSGDLKISGKRQS